MRAHDSGRFRAARLMTGLRFAVLVTAAWIPSHDLVYLAAYGVTGQHHALENSGHGTYWFAIGLAALLGMAALAALTIQRSHALRRQLTAVGGVMIQSSAIGRLARRVARLWLPLLGTTLAIFLVQENIEHLTQHAGHLPGLGALYAGEYAAAIPIFAILALAAAAIGSLTFERLRALADAVARAQRALRPQRETLRPPSVARLRPRQRQSVRDLGRAPPFLLAA